MLIYFSMVEETKFYSNKLAQGANSPLAIMLEKSAHSYNVAFKNSEPVEWR